MTVEELTSRQVTRRKLLKRVGVGGAVLLAAPVVTSTASAQRLPRFVCKQGCEVGGDPCGGQRPCTNADERFCTCLLSNSGRCYCHEPSFCSDLPACTVQADCPDDWACATSCCAGGKFCHPPCGTVIVAGAAAAAGGGKTSVG
jgi:hypothetical protein